MALLFREDKRRMRLSVNSVASVAKITWKNSKTKHFYFQFSRLNDHYTHRH